MFQENLKTYRKAKGLTQEDLAVRLHVVRQTISKWEKGDSLCKGNETPCSPARLRRAGLHKGE